MDCHDDLIRQSGEADDVRKLRRHLCIIRVMAAAAAARELCRRGIPAPRCTWQFEQGWMGLMREVRYAKAADGPLALDVVRIIASGVSIDDPEHLVLDAGLLLSRMQHGFIPPEPCQSETYERGWEAACQALRESHEARVLADALAEAREEVEA
jgi:hypothetical protein